MKVILIFVFLKLQKSVKRYPYDQLIKYFEIVEFRRKKR